MKALARKDNGRIYLISPLEVFQPTQDEVATYDFAPEITKEAPNENIVWLKGHYAQAEVPNRNGQMWSSQEIEIKSLTPRLMPVTSMHDPRTAVGVIAGTELLKPGRDSVETETINTILALWAHRFPEAAEEAMINHEAGTLMQSMECDAPAYSCAECGQLFRKPVDEAAHCVHLQDPAASRTLHGVTFTGTGLIFGSRGKKGADPKAYLHLLDEVAEWADARTPENEKTEPNKMTDVSIPKSEYEELLGFKAKAEAAAALQTERDELATANKELENKLTKAEADLEALNEEKAGLVEKVENFENEKAQAELASNRLSELPKELADKLPETAMQRLVKKARSMTDEDWKAEVEEKAELLNIKDKSATAGDMFGEAAMAGFNPNGKPREKSEYQPEENIAASMATMLRSRRKKD